MAENGHRLSKESQEFMEDYLLNNSGSYDSHTDRYIRFEVAQDGSDIHDVALVEKGRGVWQVEDIVPIDLSDDKARITVFAHNDETKLRIKFVLNNKNNWKFKDSGIKIRSKYMLNSPSWNVWIGKN